MQTVGINPWLILPVFAVIVTVLAYNFLGDGLRARRRPLPLVASGIVCR